MKSYSKFIFTSYSWNHHAGRITLRYSLDHKVDFEENILLPEPISDERLKAREWEIERALSALHLIGGISYYKTCLPKKIEIPDKTLTKAEAKFWNTVYERGLGEFFYRNNIDFRSLVDFPVYEEPKDTERLNRIRRKSAPTKPLSEQRVLVPIGGGKDSLVTIEMLKKSGAKVTLLRMGSHPLITELAHATGLPMLTVKRSISGNLFDLNEEGALNGHVPVTAYLSILSVLLAILYDFDAVIMSNERSASEGNVQFKNMEINHQWSKSLEFEKMLQRIVTETIGADVAYFSLLRALSELKIAEMFSKTPQYFGHFTSCNTNWRIAADDSATSGRWCNKCPKCAFVFCCMAAYVPRLELQNMFGSILFEDETLLSLFRELLGMEKFKPFECVGTAEETKAAFLLARKNGSMNKSPAMQMFETEVLPSIADPEALIAACLTPNDQHCIPKEFLPLLSDRG